MNINNYGLDAGLAYSLDTDLVLRSMGWPAVVKTESLMWNILCLEYFLFSVTFQDFRTLKMIFFPHRAVSASGEWTKSQEFQELVGTLCSKFIKSTTTKSEQTTRYLPLLPAYYLSNQASLIPHRSIWCLWWYFSILHGHSYSVV